MGWGKLITSIGGIVGGLIDNLAVGEDGAAKAVMFRLPKSGQPGDDGASLANAVFTYDDDGNAGSKKQFRLFNSSSRSTDVINMAFPAIGDIGPQTLFVQGRQTCAVNDEFSLYGGQGDCSNFSLEATDTSASQGLSGDAGGFKISSMGYNVPVDGKTQKQIGSRISVTVSPESITVKNIGTSGNISAIDLLTIAGAGDSKITIMGQSGQSGTEITIPLPHELKSTVVDVSLTADFTNGAGIVKEFADKHKNDGKLRTLSPSEHEALLKKYNVK
jgi:hypothetical protein